MFVYVQSTCLAKHGSISSQPLSADQPGRLKGSHSLSRVVLLVYFSLLCPFGFRARWRFSGLVAIRPSIHGAQIISIAITINQTKKNNTNDFKMAEQVLLTAINPSLIGQSKIGMPSMWTDNLRTYIYGLRRIFFPRKSLSRRITATGQTTCPYQLLLVPDKRTSVISNTAK